MSDKDINSAFNSRLKYFITNISAINVILFLFALGTIVYINGIFNTFVRDDISQIVENTNIYSIKNIVSFFNGGTFYSDGSVLSGVYYRPIFITALSLLYTLFGPNFYAFHTFQIIFHILNTGLLYGVLMYFFRKKVAFVLSILFLIHPINSESVLYISNIQDVLFLFFGMLSFWVIVHLQRGRYLLITMILLLFSLLSKETGLVFIVISVIFLLLFKRRYTYSFFVCSVPYFIIYLILRLRTVGIFTNPVNAPITKLDIFQRLLNIPAIIFFYIKTFAFPLHLSASYQWVYTHASFSNFYLPLLIDVLFFCTVIVFAFILYRRSSKKYFLTYLFFFLWFLLGLLFHIQIIPLDATVAERWFYFPIIGILGMMGIFIETNHFSGKKIVHIIVISIILAAFSLRTILRSFDWRDDLTLALHDIQISKEAFDLENSISIEYLKGGRLSEAKVHAEKSVALYPAITNYNTLGLVYLKLEDYQKSKEIFLKSLELGNSPIVYSNLTGLTLLHGDSDENIAFLKKALKIYPQNSKIWLTLAILQYKQGDTENAQIAVGQAYSYNRSSEVRSFYDTIMNNQPLNINFNIK